jgi:hypothetical protein
MRITFWGYFVGVSGGWAYHQRHVTIVMGVYIEGLGLGGVFMCYRAGVRAYLEVVQGVEGLLMSELISRSLLSELRY